MIQIKESGYQYLLSSGEKHLSLLRADQKFLLVPLGFMILRVWDIVITTLYVYSQPSDNDQQETKHYKSLGYLDVSCVYVCVCVYVHAYVCVVSRNGPSFLTYGNQKNVLFWWILVCWGCWYRCCRQNVTTNAWCRNVSLSPLFSWCISKFRRPSALVNLGLLGSNCIFMSLILGGNGVIWFIRLYMIITGSV